MSPFSKHYCDPEQEEETEGGDYQIFENEYVRCMKAVTHVLDQYDTDKKYRFYGFGGIPTYMRQHEVSHCFPLTGDTYRPNISGVHELLKIYKSHL